MCVAASHLVCPWLTWHHREAIRNKRALAGLKEIEKYVTEAEGVAKVRPIANHHAAVAHSITDHHLVQSLVKKASALQNDQWDQGDRKRKPGEGAAVVFRLCRESPTTHRVWCAVDCGYYFFRSDGTRVKNKWDNIDIDAMLAEVDSDDESSAQKKGAAQKQAAKKAAASQGSSKRRQALQLKDDMHARVLNLEKVLTVIDKVRLPGLWLRPAWMLTLHAW